ncbi:MAG: metal-dependent transcriptional regulator [Spirochaetales bacterium]|nr:metal-dependent transcriptional regulator [Spirochaetales bacterium]
MEIDLETISSQFPAAAEYLSNLFLINRDYGTVSNQRLAEWMGVSTPAVTQALGRLKKLGLVDYKRYEPAQLTETGRIFALRVLKRHYLLEHLLVRLLDFPWDKADLEARVLQNQISQDLERHLDAKLGYPQTCPHGNPLPGASIEAKLLNAPRLHQAPAGIRILILRITEEGEAIPAMLPFCQTYGIKPGGHFEVQTGPPHGVSLAALDVKTRQPSPQSFFLPQNLAQHIRYEPMELES